MIAREVVFQAHTPGEGVLGEKRGFGNDWTQAWGWLGDLAWGKPQALAPSLIRDYLPTYLLVRYPPIISSSVIVGRR